MNEITQDQYAEEIDAIVRQEVLSFSTDWFEIDRTTFMKPENKNLGFIFATRDSGFDILFLEGQGFNENNINRILGLNQQHFYICYPRHYFEPFRNIRKISGCKAVKEIQLNLPMNWYLIYDVFKDSWILRQLMK